MKSLSLKTFLTNAIMVGIGLFMVAVLLVAIGRSYLVSTYQDRMEESVLEISRTASAIAEEESIDSWTLGMTISSVSLATGNHMFVTDETGVVVSCADGSITCEHIGKVIPEAILSFISQTDGECSIIRSTIGGFYDSTRIVVCTPIRSISNGVLLGYVFCSAIEGEIYSSWSTFLWMAMIVFAGIFLFLLFFLFLYTKKMSEPLDEIAAASRLFARGDFSARVKQVEEPSTEMGAVIDSFNKMADSLENAETKRSEFISNVSHELRTPMTTIAGFADGILDGTIPQEEAPKYLRSIRDETRRLARLVRSMLATSKTQATAGDPSKRTIFDISELAVETLLSFETRATEKHLDVDPQLPDNSLIVRADKDSITQVIYNLLDNAVKFAKEGSCITLRIYKQGEKAYVSVIDEGETIPPDDLPFIFDRFHKSDRSRSLDKDGVGLGLYLVKTIINAHDEDIAVKSENGVTEFVFTLPLAN